MNRRGQLLLEWNLTLALILFPLIFGLFMWFYLEWNRTQCAYQSFFFARQNLIATHQAVHYRAECSKISETVSLLPLEALDQNKSALWFSDLMKEASQLSEDASSSLRSLQEQASSTPSLTSTNLPARKSISTTAAETSF